MVFQRPGRPVSSWAVENRSEEEVRQVIQSLILELAPNPDGISAGDRLVEDLEYHSLALMELAFSLEDEFNLEAIDEETARGIRTVGDVKDHVVSELDRRAGLARS